MHMKENPMKNSQLKPGYNVQIGVEGEYISGIDISSERSDQPTLIPFLKNIESKLDKKYKNIIADAGYESEENYVYLEKQQYTAFIKPQTYEISKKKKFKNNISKKENMYYDCENDQYKCEDCSTCIYKNKCTKANGNRQIHVSKKFINLRARSLNNITSPKGTILRMNRFIQVEGAFGVLKQNYGFRQILTRGKKNVKCEFLLLSIAFNVNKFHNKISKNKLGVSFFLKEII